MASAGGPQAAPGGRPHQANKVFVGGLSWETTDEKLAQYFSNYGEVTEAFVSFDRNTGRPRGFGFVCFADPAVVDKVVAQSKHHIDRREVEAKRAVPKDDTPAPPPPAGGDAAAQKTRKIFVGGLAPTVDETVLRQYFESFGAVEDAVVMYDHDNKRPRGFGFITFVGEESVDKVFAQGAMQSIHDKQIEIKPAVPRDQMPPARRAGVPRPCINSLQSTSRLTHGCVHHAQPPRACTYSARLLPPRKTAGPNPHAHARMPHNSTRPPRRVSAHIADRTC